MYMRHKSSQCSGHKTPCLWQEQHVSRMINCLDIGMCGFPTQVALCYIEGVVPTTSSFITMWNTVGQQLRALYMAWDSAYLQSPSTSGWEFHTVAELYVCGMELFARVELFNLWHGIVHTCGASYMWWCKQQQLCKEPNFVGLHLITTVPNVLLDCTWYVHSWCHMPLKFRTTVPHAIWVPSSQSLGTSVSWITMRHALIYAKMCTFRKTMDYTTIHCTSTRLP